MQIVNEDLISMRISKEYEIEIDETKTIIINKWIYEDSYGNSDYDNDWEILPESQKTYDELSEEEKDQLNDFISEISISLKN